MFLFAGSGVGGIDLSLACRVSPSAFQLRCKMDKGISRLRMLSCTD